MSESKTVEGPSCHAPGCGLGSIAAFALSWHTNHAFWWAVLHFFCGWFYVLYWIVKHL